MKDRHLLMSAVQLRAGALLLRGTAAGMATHFCRTPGDWAGQRVEQALHDELIHTAGAMEAQATQNERIASL